MEKKTKEVVKRESGTYKTLTETQKFRFTPKMAKWLDTALELQTISPTEISAKCKVTRESYYTWRAIPGFNEWFISTWQAKRSQWIPILDIMGMKRAPKSFDYWKSMTEKAGDPVGSQVDSQPRQVVSILGGMTLNTVNYNKVQQTSEQQDT
jgi:hypothetical protein